MSLGSALNCWRNDVVPTGAQTVDDRELNQPPFGAAASEQSSATTTDSATSFGTMASPCGAGDASGATDVGVTDQTITIGYGDVVPITPLGKMIAAVTSVGGLIMIALPVGIIATAFSDQIHRRDFVVTWGMVARVPLFNGLDASAIAQIMRLLRAQTANAGDVIVRRGDAAHSMYFIANGEVGVELDGKRVTLGVGHFFGEIAVLRRARRSATVRATTRTNLLVLDAANFHVLMEQEPRIAERVHTVVRDRIGREIVTPRGDIVTEEMHARSVSARWLASVPGRAGAAAMDYRSSG